MIDLRYKTFLLGKDNEPDGRQDALAVNEAAAMFAVADGVSNSFHPEIVARTLCDIFTEENPDIFDNWDGYSSGLLLPAVADLWGKGVGEYLSGLSGRILRHELANQERWRIGASTFCGLYVDREESKLRYAVIGDSTLFILMSDGALVEVNSSPKVVAGENDEELTEYSNVTSAVLSDATLSGEWLTGEFPLDGVSAVALMTDGMAKWFQNRIVAGERPYDLLWSIDDESAFAALAAATRAAGEMDDDLAVILIDFTPSPEVAEATEGRMEVIESDIEKSPSEPLEEPVRDELKEEPLPEEPAEEVAIPEAPVEEEPISEKPSEEEPVSEEPVEEELPIDEHIEDEHAEEESEPEADGVPEDDAEPEVAPMPTFRSLLKKLLKL